MEKDTLYYFEKKPTYLLNRFRTLNIAKDENVKQLSISLAKNEYLKNVSTTSTYANIISVDKNKGIIEIDLTNVPELTITRLSYEVWEKVYKRVEFGEIQQDFNMSFVIDGTKDSTQVIVYNNDKHELKPCTFVYLDRTQTWWKVKKDQVRTTFNELGNFCKHTIQLVGAIDIFANRRLVDCGFNRDRYTFAEFFNRFIDKTDFELPLINFIDNGFINLDKKISYLKTFENYAPLTALREIANENNVDFKMRLLTKVVNNETYANGYEIYTLSKSGSKNAPIDIDYFNDFAETRSSDEDSYGTRVLSNIQNCVGAEIIRYPAVGYVGFTGTTNLVDFDSEESAIIRLPSNIDKVEKIDILEKIKVRVVSGEFDSEIIYNPRELTIEQFIDKLYEDSSITLTKEQAQRIYDNAIDTLLNGGTYDLLQDKYIEPYLDIDEYNITSTKDKFKLCLNEERYAKTSKYGYETISWEQGKDIIKNFMFISKLRKTGIIGKEIFNETISGKDVYISKLIPDSTTSFAIYYRPVSDIRLVVDNDIEENDTKIYNQNGKLVDPVAVGKLVNGYATEIKGSEIVKNKTFYDFNDIPQPSQLVIDESGDIYVINNVSIDFHENEQNGYFMECQFAMTISNSCKSTMVSANTNVRDYDCPQQNNINRIQNYKDYIEFDYSFEEYVDYDDTHLPLEKVLNFGEKEYGFNNNHTLLFRASMSKYGTFDYQIGISKFNLNKQFIEIANFKDNNIIGYEANSNHYVLQASTMLQRKDSLVNTPISYVDDYGELISLSLRFVNNDQLINAYSSQGIESVIGKFVSVPKELYDYVCLSPLRYDIAINEPNYKKDGLEVPIFQYAMQVGDANGFVFGADFLKGVKTTNKYEYAWCVRENRYTQDNATYENAHELDIVYDDKLIYMSFHDYERMDNEHIGIFRRELLAQTNRPIFLLEVGEIGSTHEVSFELEDDEELTGEKIICPDWCYITALDEIDHKKFVAKYTTLRLPSIYDSMVLFYIVSKYKYDFLFAINDNKLQFTDTLDENVKATQVVVKTWQIN